MDSRNAVRSDGSSGRDRELWIGLDNATMMGVELLGAILTWAGAGYLVDRWLGTGPWLLALGALVGNAAGIYLIWLHSNQMEAASCRGVPHASDRSRP